MLVDTGACCPPLLISKECIKCLINAIKTVFTDEDLAIE